jgi:hypothetical protein
LRPQSATTTLTRTVTVAAGVFAPGHLGELTQYLPFELVDDVLEQTRTVQRRLRELPSRVGVYFLLALGMFPRLGYARGWAKLTAGLAGMPVPCPSEKALRDLRRRLGPAPMKALFEVCGRAAGPATHPWGALPGAAHGRLRWLQLTEGARHPGQPVLAGQDPLPGGGLRKRQRHETHPRVLRQLGGYYGRSSPHGGAGVFDVQRSEFCWSL